MIDDLIPTGFNHSDPEKSLVWRAAQLLVFYRLILSITFVFAYLFLPEGNNLLGYDDSAIFFAAANIYLVFSIYAVIANYAQWPSLTLQIYLHSIVDIFVIVIFMHTSGGIASGIGVLLIVTVASTGVFIRPRGGIAFAAGASLLVLLEHSYRVLSVTAPPSYYLQAGLLGATLFMAVIVANVLSKQVRESQALANQRGVDLANMGQLNEYIIQRMGAGVVVVDTKKQIRLMNEAARLLLGQTNKRQGYSLEEISEPLALQHARWRSDPRFESQVFRVTGAVAIYPRFTRLGMESYAGSLILLEDTSLLDQQAQHMKMTALGRLTASIAHEIRNPLGAISHAGQLLEESENLDKADKRLTQIIREQSVRMNTIIENIMQLSRRDKSIAESIDLSVWMKDFLKEFAQAHNLDINSLGLDISPHDVKVWMDPSHLHQILSNLCQNGVRHGGDHKGNHLIEIRGGQSLDSVGPFLDVIDFGPGIEPEMASQIFEPFFTTATKGTGLGLYIARELAESNQAHLDYVPIPTGGSCFRISFANKMLLTSERI